MRGQGDMRPKIKESRLRTKGKNEERKKGRKEESEKTRRLERRKE